VICWFEQSFCHRCLTFVIFRSRSNQRRVDHLWLTDRRCIIIDKFINCLINKYCIFTLSRARRCAENTFALLIRKFAILQSCMNFDKLHCRMIIELCCRLHNWLMEKEGTGIKDLNLIFISNYYHCRLLCRCSAVARQHSGVLRENRRWEAVANRAAVRIGEIEEQWRPAIRRQSTQRRALAQRHGRLVCQCRRQCVLPLARRGCHVSPDQDIRRQPQAQDERLDNLLLVIYWLFTCTIVQNSI
jgi:hypothetical protein